MTTALKEIPLADEHKQVKHQSQQLRDLEDKHARATAHVAALIAEQQQLRSTSHSADVHSLLAGGDLAEGCVERLAQLDSEIARANAEQAALKDAVEMRQTIAHGVRQQIERERHEQINATVRASLADMEIKVRDVHTLNLRLATFAEQAPGVLVPFPGLLETWLAQVRSLLGGR